MEIKTYIRNMVLLLAAAGAVSCVKEDAPEDCPPEGESVVLYVDFAEKLYGTRSDALKAEVETMHVFVFGHDGYYIRTLVDETPDVGHDYIIPVPLEPGDYEFIGWTNLHGCYSIAELDLIAGKTTVEELFIELDISRGDTITDVGNHLHYGLAREAQLADGNRWEYYMQLDRYTYTINVITEGLEADSDDYRFVIGDRNGRYSFYSDDISDRTIYYVADCDKSASGQLSSSLRVLRLMEDHLDSTVRIENITKETLLYDDMLIERLLQMRDLGEVVDFSKKYEYTLKLIFSSGALVAITIDGWIVWKADDYDL